ncbi:MAG: thioesterase family protein [Deltaproteobacteria bacterium]|nr:thioesterase family protein [Deltaproteobacteria bacterium]
MLQILGQMHETLAFNKVLGLRIVHLRPDSTECRFPMKDEFIGNPILGILHGGVISAVLDATGGINASVSALERMKDLSKQEIGDRLSRMGTIDLRIDYLRPGKGNQFRATSAVMRTGRKVAVTRMELKNQDDVLIAVGTGAYLIG